VPPFARFRNSASFLVVVFALLVRVIYVPYHLAVDEHQEAHGHGSAVNHEMVLEAVHACVAHPAEQAGHEHDDGHPPHAAEDHDTELAQVRSSLGHAPLAQLAVLEAETWRLVLSQARVVRSSRAPPLRRESSRGVQIARGPPATV